MKICRLAFKCYYLIMKTADVKTMPLAAAILSLMLAASGCSLGQGQSNNSSGMKTKYDTKFKISGRQIMVEVVREKQDMVQGLSGRDRLEENQGMLFDYGNGAGVVPEFWMKDMKFSLDLVWIKDKKISGITRNVPVPKPESGQLPLYYPPGQVDQVLEVNAGWTDRNEVKPGDEAVLIKE